MNRLALTALALALTCFASADPWRFVVAGDGRSDGKTKRDSDKNGINVTITREIANAVVKEKAKFLAWTGDLVMGYCKTAAEFESQLLDWRAIMQPVYDANIPVLAARGNHDASSPDALAVWNRVFFGKYAMPKNGPAGERGVTFFYGKGDVLMVGLDQYGAKKETVNQAWLDQVLNRYPKPFVFTFGHEPAFMDGAHKDNLDADVAARDAFWESLIAAGSKVYFCGHDHLYDHMIVKRGRGDEGPETHQIVAGTAGAPFYPMGDYTGKNSYWNLSRAKHVDNTYGYLLVTIDGMDCTIEFKGRVGAGTYKTMDKFSYRAAAR